MPPSVEVFEFGRLSRPGDIGWAAAWAAAAAAFAAWSAWGAGTGLSRGRRAALVALRWAALGLAGWAALEPRRRTETAVVRPAGVAVVVDVSASMATRDDGPSAPSRWERLRAAVEAAEWPARFPHAAWWSCGRAVAPLPVAAWAARPPADPESRLADGVADAVRALAGKPIGGVVLLSDGRRVGGSAWESARAAARALRCPVHAVAVGSEAPPRNLRIAEAQVPPRVFPGDPVRATARLVATNVAERTAEVVATLVDRGRGTTTELFRREVPVPAAGAGVPLVADAVAPAAGRYAVRFAVRPLPGEARVDDNAAEADFDAAARRTRVMLLASGPTREFQFVRNLLHRDPTMETVVVLQSGAPGLAQDAAAARVDLPEQPSEVFAFDAAVAFDPDWAAVSDAARRAFVAAVSEQGMGLAYVAGPLHTPALAERFAEVAALLPVVPKKVFADELAQPATEPWPLRPTEAGAAFAPLRLDDDPAAAASAWEAFPGFHWSLPLARRKPGATALLEFGDPRARLDGAAAPAVAWQHFGTGRVMFVGSGEWWRLRAVDEGRHERLWTQLVRHVAEPRLLRGGPRGGFLVEQREWPLGTPIPVRGRFLDERFEPLRVPRLAVAVAAADGPREVAMEPQPGQPGVYAALLHGVPPGPVRLQAHLGGGVALEETLRVVETGAERDDVRADRAALARLCRDTGGRLVELDALAELTPLLDVPPETTIVSGPPRPLWDHWALAAGIVALLAADMALRKLARLP